VEVNFIRLAPTVEDESVWTFVLCKTEQPEDTQVEFSERFKSAGAALNFAMKWCADRGLALNWYRPMDVQRPMKNRENVVEATDRFRPPTPFRSHPSQKGS
jgi:hypothetical protein